DEPVRIRSSGGCHGAVGQRPPLWKCGDPVRAVFILATNATCAPAVTGCRNGVECLRLSARLRRGVGGVTAAPDAGAAVTDVRHYSQRRDRTGAGMGSRFQGGACKVTDVFPRRRAGDSVEVIPSVM